MRRLLALAVLVSLMPTSNAETKNKADFSHNAEYRARYWWTQNPGGDENTLGTNSNFDHRFKLGTSFRASEKFSANFTLLHNATWGESAGVGAAGGTAGNDAENVVVVNEVYGNWMVSEDLSFRFGRQNFQIGDGSVMGVNDWEPNPYFFEGVAASYEMELGKFQPFAFKFRDYTTLQNSANKDAEQNAYGLSFDLKTMPEWMKTLNLHVIQVNGDAIRSADVGSDVQGLQGQDNLRYGLMAGFVYSMFDAKFWYAGHTGKNKHIAADGTKTEYDASGMMIQAEAGVNVENFMRSRFFVQYHQDSGDENINGNKHETYDSFFYEKHANAGLMDLFGWGNLTYITAGWTGKATDKTDVGLTYSMFSRTESGTNAASAKAGTAGVALFNGVTPASDDSKLGDEIDLWAEHHYDGGLSAVARLGYFSPGDYFKNATAGARSDNITQVMLEAKMTF